MQTIPSIVHRFPPTFIKAQEITPEFPPVLPFFISHPNSSHTLFEQHHMNTVILVRKHLHTQILCVLNFLFHSHTHCLSAAKLQQGADKLCPPLEFCIKIQNHVLYPFIYRLDHVYRRGMTSVLYHYLYQKVHLEIPLGD